MLFSDSSLEPLKKIITHRQGVLISDSIVYPLYGEQIMQLAREKSLQLEPIIVPAGEQSKTLSSAHYCWEKMYALGLDRTSLVIGLGGGMITDLAGFVASCYMRGIDHLLIPTSLMGMVDAAIGGKTAINLPNGKNLIGSFYHPKEVVIAPHFLTSLPQREISSGLAEVIKCAVIWDEPFFNYLEGNLKRIVEAGPEEMNYLIEKTASIKIEIVKQDEKDRSLRAILNWGHTFAHALETVSHYQTFRHGEAVAIGMCCAACVSHALGLVDRTFLSRQTQLLRDAHLPTTLPSQIDIQELLTTMRGDKKATSRNINLIVAKKIGQVEQQNNINPTLIEESLLLLQES